jgi:rhodanese-related sulfurtransferase
MEIIDFLFAEGQLFTTITLILLIVLLIGSFITDKLKKYEDIDVHQAVKLMDESITILDVREKKERKDGYIKEDTHIPLASVKSKLDTLEKNKKILVYCRSGARASHICGLLTKNDFNQVYNLKGGILAWKKANLPINT